MTTPTHDEIATDDAVAVHQVTCHRCGRTAHVGTRPSSLPWAVGEMGWRTEDDRHTCPECLDLATEERADESDPLPTEGAPHAYVAVMRTHSPHADRPEWKDQARVIPAWSREEYDWHWRKGFDLIPIVPDGGTGTRAIDPATVEQLADERKLTDDQSTALAKAIAERDAYRRELLELRAVHDQLLGRYAVAVADKRAAEQAVTAVVQVAGSVHQTDGQSDVAGYPDQPPEVDPDDSTALPDLAKAADRIEAFLSGWGDGCIESAGDAYLFARDLFVLARHAQKGEADGE